MTKMFLWAWNRFRPSEGWLPLFLLLGTIISLSGAVLEANWTPEDDLVVSMVVFGLLLATVIAKQPIPPLRAWLWVLFYAPLAVVVASVEWVGNAPPLRQQLALLWDRSASWVTAVINDDISQETIVFSLGMGLVAWFLGAGVAWSTYRMRRPLLALSLMGLVISFNSYYGGVDVWWIALFVGCAVLLTAVMHYSNLMVTWEARGVDYSPQIQIDLLTHAGGIALVLLVLSFAVPSFSIQRLRDAFVAQPVVQEAEETFSRVFAGVRPPDPLRDESNPSTGAYGQLPRAYLLGNAPELQEVVMMTTVVTPTVRPPKHWRALSYDVYTGRGWSISEERLEDLPANTPLPLPERVQQTTYVQTVDWRLDGRRIRYTIGEPVQFDQDVLVSWRGLSDLARVRTRGPQSYTAISRLATPSPDYLRQLSIDQVEDVVLARYTSLPDDIPQRVHELARDITASAPTAYDQAKAIETFLRQYPYSLDVDPPPVTADPVDYFLFELQQGYCDYYASSMVVLARSLGLPARLAVGYLAQEPDANGRQVIRQINGHSWAEIYFAGVGWVEFEPTASFSPALPDTPITVEAGEPPVLQKVAPLPPPDPTRAWGWLWWLLVLLAIVTSWWWRKRQHVPRDPALAVYQQLQHGGRGLGQAISPSQTPQEFVDGLQEQLAPLAEFPRLQEQVQTVEEGAQQVVTHFNKRLYAEEKPPVDEMAEAWGRVKRPLWFLRVVRLVRLLMQQ